MTRSVATPFRTRFAAFGLLAALSLILAPASRAAVGELFVTSDASNIVRNYSGLSGGFMGNFTSSVLGIGQLGIHFGATNNRVLVGHFGGGVDEFDGTSGAYIKTYNPQPETQWVGIYRPSDGNVLIGNFSTGDVRVYDKNTGAFISMLCPVYGPSDMKIGPNGHLYICSYYGGFVLEVNANTGAPFSSWPQPAGARTNDIAFNPVNGEILVTTMSAGDCVHRYDSTPAHNPLGTFQGTGWARPHGIEISPYTGNVLVVDGVTGQVHEFDPVTYTELNPNFLVPAPGDKIVDLDFRPDYATPSRSTSWGRIKSLYR